MVSLATYNGSQAPKQANAAKVFVQRRVELTDTDSTGHYHHSTVIRWVEAAEYVLYDRLGLQGFPVLPRVRFEANYRERLWQNQLVNIELGVRLVGRTSLNYGFHVRRANTLCVEGTMIVVFPDPATGRAIPWPDHARQAFSEAGSQPPEVLGRVASPGEAEPSRITFDPWGIGFG